MIRVDRLDAAVWEDVRGLLLEPERIEAEYRRRLAQPSSASDQDRKALASRSKGLSAGSHG
jgi:site-specific DNA recombinase